MKKTITILLALLLLLTGCAGKQESPTVPPTTEAPTQPSTTQPPESTAPETTAPKTTPVRIMGEGIPVILDFLEGGETVKVTGYQGNYAQVTADAGEGLVETRLLRFADDPFESFTGYARWNAGLYGGMFCLGEPLETLSTNTKLTVLEDLQDCYYVNFNGETGFVPAKQLSRYPYTPQPEGGSSGASGGGGGGEIWTPPVM